MSILLWIILIILATIGLVVVGGVVYTFMVMGDN